jgi:hypothetical protein
MAEISTTLLFSVSLKVTEIQNLGKTPLGDRRVAVVEGGSFEGLKLKGNWRGLTAPCSSTCGLPSRLMTAR